MCNTKRTHICRQIFFHHALHTDSQLFLRTRRYLTLGCCSQASITFCHPLFRMKCMEVAHSTLIFPLLFASSFFNEARVQIFAASRALCKIGCKMVHATVAGAILVSCTTRSRFPLMPHIGTRRTPWRP